MKNPSSQVYKIIKPKELRELFFAYHTMDPSQAIERILEAKGYPINEEEELKRQYEIFRRIRKGSYSVCYLKLQNLVVDNRNILC